MIKKILTIGLALAVVASLGGPAAGAKKKKKGPKPYTSEEVTIAVGHHAFHSASESLVTITAQEFLATCSLPNSNGIDAYVFEVPAPYIDVEAEILAKGSGSVAGHDLDIYLFDESCAFNGVYNSTSVDEAGLMAKGTRFILLHNYQGDPVTAHFELKPSSF